ncbi:hypothetical protein, partial [Streptomyces iakyrus]|uniref:hypothetical protein n=1 Tax=Streptomyces iakyrus TaxID=68219 RepID=UPI003D90D9F0
LSAKDVHRFTHHDFVDRVGLAATVGGEFIATVRYDRIGADGTPASAPADEAEVAFLVQDAHQGRGSPPPCSNTSVPSPASAASAASLPRCCPPTPR